MLLVNAEIQGFTSYYDKSSIEFKEGLTGIIGEYEDDTRKSMGAGKSSIPMSLLFALFGKGSFKTQKEIINDEYTDKQHMYAKHRFKKHNILYEVERGYLNGSSYLDFYQIDIIGGDEHKSPLGENKIASKEDAILNVLNWDFDMFTASIFFEQDKLSKLIDTDGAKKREYIEKVLHIRNWTLLQDFPKKKIGTLEKQQNDIQQTIIEIKNNIEHINTQLAQYTSLDEEINQLLEKKKDTIKIKDSLIVSSEQIKTDISELKNIESEYNTLILNKENYEKFLQTEANSIEEATTAIINIEKNISNLTEEINEINNNKLNIVAEINKLTNDNSALKQHELSLNNNLLKKEIEIQQIIKHIDNFESSVCSQCEQTITEEYKEEKLTFYNNQINDMKVQLTVLTSELQAIKQEQESILSLLQDKQIVEKELDNKSRSITTSIKENHQEENHKKETINSSKDRISQYELHLTDTKNKIINLLSSLNKFEITQIEQIKELIINKTALLQNEELYTKISKELDEIEKQIETKNISKGVKINLEKSLSENLKLKEEKEKDLIDVGKEINVELFILKGFRQIPSIKFNEEIEKLQVYANSYIKQFIPYMSIFIKEDITKANKPIDIYYDLNGKDRSYRMLSGGQKTVGNLGLRLAFSKIISEKTSSASDFLILDEPFAYLDEYSRELVKEVLIDLQKIYRQIFAISHIDNVVEFPNIIKTQMRGQRSYIV